MATGKIKWYDRKKHFGFIVPDDGGPDIFVHQSSLQPGIPSLNEGQPVEYDTESTPRGVKAVAVKPC